MKKIDETFKKKKISTLITIIVLGLIALYIYKNLDSYKNITSIKPLYIIPIAITYIIGTYINGLTFKILLEPYKIALKNQFLIMLAASFINLITPMRGGAGFRAIYVKKKYNLSYSKFTATFFGSYIITIFVIATIALCIFTTNYITEKTFNPIAILIFLSLAIISTFALTTKKQIKNPKNKITKTLYNIIEGWHTIKSQKKIIIEITIITLGNIIMLTVMNYLAFKGINHQITIIQSLYLTIISTLAIFINLTPGSLGITEALYMFATYGTGITPEIALLSALIIRLITSTILFILGPIANYVLIKDLKNNTSLAKSAKN